MLPRIILHQWEISPFCGKIRKVLHIKRLPYKVVDYNGLRTLKGKKLATSGKFPILEYNDERLEDSSHIFRYLEARHPTPCLLPENPQERALVHFFEDWADEALFWYEIYFRFMDKAALKLTMELFCVGRPAYEKLLFKYIGRRAARRRLKAQGLSNYSDADIVTRFKDHLGNLEAHLQKQGWLVGQAQSIADLAVAAQLDEIVRTNTTAKAMIMSHPMLTDWLHSNACTDT